MVPGDLLPLCRKDLRRLTGESESFFGHNQKNSYICGPLLDVAQLVAHLVRDQEVAGSSPVIQTRKHGGPSPTCFFE